MSNHSKVFVLLEAWTYNSPQIKFLGKEIDIGLFAESLIYYDEIYINFTSVNQFNEFLVWFKNQNLINSLIKLFKDGILKIYYYPFETSAYFINEKKFYTIRNTIWVNNPKTLEFDSFEKKYLYTKEVKEITGDKKTRSSLLKEIRNNLIVANSNDYNDIIENANSDFIIPERCQLIVQYFINEACSILNIKNVPKITVNFNYNRSDKSSGTILISKDFFDISNQLRNKMIIGESLPLTAAGRCNRLIKTASLLNSDILLSNPMSNLVGDKLYEISSKNIKLQDIIEQLNKEVEFPNIRQLVNDNILTLENIIDIRKKSIKFRKWLQSEADRDRNAIIAYHYEISKKIGLLKFGKSTLKLFGIFGGAYIGTKIGIKDPVIGALSGATITSVASDYLFNILSKFESGWKPIIFGNWLNEKIKKIIK